MEHSIAKLLREYENGRITRRQLIQSLGLMMSTVSTFGAASPASADGKGFKAVAVNHISYQVADYAKTRDFYAGLFGMKVSHDDGKQCYLAFGDTFLIPRNHPTDTPRIDHIAYTIDAWENKAVEAELRRRGLQPRPDTENSFHVDDPNGFDLQISGREMKA
jgi:catechol 2,3-dioxygenase-like lactoylglutathione lyase family enzyme